MHTGNIYLIGVGVYDYITMMMAKMSKTGISAKILKGKKIKNFIIRITPKSFSAHVRGYGL